MDREIWKDVVGYEGLYRINNKGDVFSVRKSKNMKLCKTGNGYLKVGITKNGKTKYIDVHRLVAIAFIKNERNLKEINHIDGNKENNSVENLEWSTRSENVKHAYKNGLNKRIKKVLKMKGNNIVERYDSISSASILNKINAGHLFNYIKKSKAIRGFLYVFE